MTSLVIDIETENIPALVSDIKTIHCIAIKKNNEPTKCYTSTLISNSDGSLNDAVNIISKADLVIGHNICKFDIPVIEKLLCHISCPIVDTLIDAKLTYPKDILKGIDYGIDELPTSLVGSYSLEAFGYRFGLNKIEFEDFTKLTEDMVTYCKRDVDLTYELYNHLRSHVNYPSSKVRELEYKVASIIYNQQEFGFWFDIDKAMELATKLKFRQMNLEHKLLKTFPPKFEPDGDAVIPSKARVMKLRKEVKLPSYVNLTNYFSLLPIAKNGKYKFPPKSMKWSDKPYRIIPQLVEGEYQKIKLVKFNPNSRQQIANRLIETFGWKPINYTEKGNIKVDESILGETYEDNEEV